MPKTTLPLPTHLRLLPDVFARLEPSGFLADMPAWAAAEELMTHAEAVEMYLSAVKLLAADVHEIASDHAREDKPRRDVNVMGQLVNLEMRRLYRV